MQKTRAPKSKRIANKIESVTVHYARMESANRGDWCMVGVRAEAEISIPTGPGYSTLQTIHSGGLWGIESNSGADYIASVEKDELDNLRAQLTALGFSKRAIAMAFKDVQHKDE